MKSSHSNLLIAGVALGLAYLVYRKHYASVSVEDDSWLQEIAVTAQKKVTSAYTGTVDFVSRNFWERILEPRGIRNNNPGNIRRTGTQWRGMAPDQSADDEYVIFTDAFFGIRAMVKILRNYQSLYDLRTVEGIISRWAPSHENPTNAYVENVARSLQVSPQQRIDVDDFMMPLLKAIILQENGKQPYPDRVILDGIAWADK